MSNPSPSWWSCIRQFAGKLQFRGYLGVVALIVIAIVVSLAAVLANTDDPQTKVLVAGVLGAVAVLALVLALFFALMREKLRGDR